MSAIAVDLEHAPADAEVLWKPHPGFQTRFLSSGAYEVLAGGAAGPGKTDCLLFGGLAHIDNPATSVLFLRRTFPELREVMDRAATVFPQLGAEYIASEKRWRFPAGSYYELGFGETLLELQRYQGRQFTEIRYDELGQVASEDSWTFLGSRCRSPDPSVRAVMRASANPGGRGHGWLMRRFIVPCGERGERLHTDPDTGLTRAFVPGRLEDNPTLMQNDPLYAKRLESLPDVMRRQLRYGDWNATAGLYFTELTETSHLCGPVEPESWWPVWGSFDWGFAHPFAACAFTQDDEGTIYLLESVHGSRLLPDEIADRLHEKLPGRALRELQCGHDVWAQRRAFGGGTPTIAETLESHEIWPVRANIDRVLGWTACRTALARMNADGTERKPRLRIVDTPGNRRTIATLLSLVCDPKHPEDVLKVDATGQGAGGDDAADAFRYGLSNRVYPSSRPAETERFSPVRDLNPIYPSTRAGDSAGGTFSQFPDGY